MKRHLFLLAALGAFSPGASMAQGGDAAYCAKLGELVTKYIGKQINGQNRPDSESLVAMDRCDHGDTAAGIPILEKKLKSGGFTLPPR
jgi:hypothetical protein